MKHIFTPILLALLLQFGVTSAQTYSISPSHTVSGTVQQNDYLDLEIDINNTSAGNLTVQYEAYQNTLDSNWYVTVCDYQTCYPFVPPALETMEPVAPGGHAFIKVTVNPQMVLASGSVSFVIWDSANSAIKDTLIYNINSVVGVDNSLDNRIIVSPNPSAGGRFVVQARDMAIPAGQFMVTDITGRMVLSVASRELNAQAIDLSNANPGVYLIRFSGEDGKGFTRRVMKN